MKTLPKILTALLLCALLLCCLTACNGDRGETKATEGKTTEATEESATELELTLDFEKKNYGKDVYLQVYDLGTGNDNLKKLWVKESDSSLVSEAMYNRQQALYSYLGVTLVGSSTGGTFQTYHERFTTAVKNKDGSVDIFVPNVYMAVAGLISGGYVRDLNTMDALNLTADYWNIDYMEELALHGRYYLGFSDFNLPEAYCIAFNKDMMEKYADSLDGSIYEMVDYYRWTLDQMIAVANLVYTDTTGDGKTDDDTYGITGVQWVPFIPFLQASGIQLVSESEDGALEVSVFNDLNKEKTTALVDTLYELAKSNSAWFRFKEENISDLDLPTGRSLMTLKRCLDLPNYLSTDISFGVLPYPMFDEAQKEYRSLDFGMSTMVPTYLENEQMVGETLEVLSFYSEPVQIAVYEKMLGKQVSDAPDDKRMLDVIWNNLCSDFGLTYSTLNGALDKNLYMLPILTNPNGTDMIASYVKSYNSAANRSIKKFMLTVEKIDG